MYFLVNAMKKFFAYLLFCFSLSAYADQPIRVLLDWLPNPNQAPLFIAKQHGFFKAHHVDVELIAPADPTDPPKLVAANQADIAITYEPQYIQAVDQGLPLFAIGTLIDKPLACLAALQSSHIHDLRDLANKQIGYSMGGADFIMLNTMLNHAQADLSQHVKMVNVHYNLLQALLSHQVAAITGIMRTSEVAQLAMIGQPVRIFLPEKNGVPTYSELIFIVNTNKKNDPRWPQFLAALHDATAWLKAHPRAGWQDFIQACPSCDTPLNQHIWTETLPYFTDQPTNFNHAQWQAFIKFMHENGMIRHTEIVSQINKE